MKLGCSRLRFKLAAAVSGTAATVMAAVSFANDSAWSSSTPYRGTVVATVHHADGRVEKVSGSGQATFGRERMVVEASLRKKTDSGFSFTGAPSGGGWSGRGGPLAIEVDRSGRVRGGGLENGHRIGIGGTADARTMNLRVETVRVDASQGPGTRIVFDYTLSRQAVAQRTETTDRARPKPASQKGKCTRRVWQMRNVAAPNGGMTMTQVPVCVD